MKENLLHHVLGGFPSSRTIYTDRLYSYGLHILHSLHIVHFVQLCKITAFLHTLHTTL